MERNGNRYTYYRRQGQHQHQQQQQQQQSSSSLSSSSSSSISSTSNNNQQQQQQQMDNHSSASNYSSSSNTNTTPAYSPPNSREPLTQHDELIRYIREAWTNVSEHGTPVIYRNESDQQLKNFKPFNLEEYWGQRLVQNIHGHQ